jgi:hypothetical protein
VETPIRIAASGRDQAERLVTAVAPFQATASDSSGSWEVDVHPDAESAERLIGLFDAIGRWLDEAGSPAATLTFGARTFTLVRSTAAGDDPTQFLLERTIQLQSALESRILIEQAKGALTRELSLEPDDAFRLLRQTARSQRRRIHDVAAEVVSAASRGEPAPQQLSER